MFSYNPDSLFMKPRLLLQIMLRLKNGTFVVYINTHMFTPSPRVDHQIRIRKQDLSGKQRHGILRLLLSYWTAP